MAKTPLQTSDEANAPSRTPEPTTSNPDTANVTSTYVGTDDPTVATDGNHVPESTTTIVDVPVPEVQPGGATDPSFDQGIEDEPRELFDLGGDPEDGTEVEPPEPRGPFFEDEMARQEAEASERNGEGGFKVAVIDAKGRVTEKTYGDDIPLSLGVGGTYKLVDGKRIRVEDDAEQQ